MARRARWTPSLHPRGPGGRFAVKGSGGRSPARVQAKAAAKQQRAAVKAATKAGNQVADAANAKVRRKAYRRAGFRAAGGTVRGVALVGVGLHTKDHKYTAAGVGRLGLNAAEARHNFKTAKRTTSKAFHAQSDEDKARELRKRSIRSAQYSIAGGAADFAAGHFGRKKLQSHMTQRVYEHNTRQEWEQTKAFRHTDPDFKQRESGPYTRYQGPSFVDRKKAGTSRLRRNKGVYDIRGGTPIGKPAQGLLRYRKVGTGKSAAQRAGEKFSAAATKARRGKQSKSTAVALRNNAFRGTGNPRARTGRLGDSALVRANQKLGNKAKPRSARAHKR